MEVTMQTPKPGAARTTRPAANAHKPAAAPRIVFPIQPEAGADIKYILAYAVLKDDAALQRLEAMRDAEWRRSKWTDTPVSLSLSAAISAIPYSIKSVMPSVVGCGELLFCWHGTKATEVAA
jgi:hypothetical protein